MTQLPPPKAGPGGRKLWRTSEGPHVAEIGEGMIDLEVFACPTCRKVELRVPVK